MTGINSTLLNSENKENIVNSLNDSSLKLLELLNVNHGTLYTITSGGGGGINPNELNNTHILLLRLMS